MPPASEGSHWLFIIDNANDVNGSNGTPPVIVLPSLNKTAARLVAHVSPSSAAGMPSARVKRQKQSSQLMSAPPPPPPRPFQQQQQQQQQPRQKKQAATAQKAAKPLPLPPPPLALSPSYEQWSAEELVGWAREMGWESAAELFQAHEIDGSAIGDLAYIGRDALGLLRVMREVRWEGDEHVHACLPVCPYSKEDEKRDS